MGTAQYSPSLTPFSINEKSRLDSSESRRVIAWFRQLAMAARAKADYTQNFPAGAFSHISLLAIVREAVVNFAPCFIFVVVLKPCSS